MTTITPIPGALAGGDLSVDHGAVLVPLDGSELSERAVEPARWLAALLGTSVHTVVVAFVDDSGWYRDYIRSVIRRWPQVTPHYVDEPGATHGIVETARSLDHCLVCMGTHGRSRSAALLGSTFTDVARTDQRPIVAIGPRSSVPASSAHRIVACVDGTPMAEQILPVAAAWARRLGATIDIVAVVEPTPPLPNHRERHGAGLLVDPGAYLDELARRPELAGLDVETHVAFDALGPEEGLLDHLRNHPAMLVATTSRLRTHVDRALHGSTAARIIHSCPVPVLVQPAREAK
jgi:nucleotide-binding universal stress UspA family protein